MRILVEHGKHGTGYFDATTDDALAKSALRILKNRDKAGWYPEPTLYLGSSTEADNLTDEQIADLPTDELRTLATKRRSDYVTRIADHKAAFEQWTEIRRIIDTDDASVSYTKWTDSKNRERTRLEIPAWELLRERGDYEYESVSLEQVLEA